MSLQGRPDRGFARHFTMATTIQRALGVVHAAPRLYVAVQVAALQPVNENLGLVDVSPQRGCFRPDGRRPAVGAGDILTVEPRQLVRHLVQLIAQRADQLHGLGGIDFIHAGMVAPLTSFCRRNGSGRDNPLDKACRHRNRPAANRRRPPFTATANLSPQRGHLRRNCTEHLGKSTPAQARCGPRSRQTRNPTDGLRVGPT